MNLGLSSAKLIGLSRSSEWIMVYDFSAETVSENLSKGQLLLIVYFQGEMSDVDRVIKTRESVAKFKENYFGNPIKKPFDSLKEACEKLVADFDIVAGQSFSIGAVAYLNGVTYTAAFGNINVAMRRGGNQATILAGNSAGLTTASGYPQDQDILIIATHSFFQEYCEEKIRSELANRPLSEGIAVLEKEMEKISQPSRIGALFILFGGQKEEANSLLPAENKPEELINNRFKNIKFPKFHWPRRKLYVNRRLIEGEETKSSKTALLVGGILLFLLVISLVFGVRQSRINKEKALFNDKLNSAREKLNEAEAVYGIDRDRGRLLFTESQQLLNEVLALNLKNQEIEKMKELIKEKEGNILGKYEAQPKLFLDLALISSGFSGSTLAVSGEKAVILDNKSSKLLSLDLETKRSEILGNTGNGGGILQAAVYDNKYFLLKEDGIYEVGVSANKIIEKQWSSKVLLAAYAGNLYLVDEQDSRIFRYPGIEGGFGAQQSWLAPGITLDLSAGVRMAIDGSIWLVAQSGKIIKLTQGAPESLEKLGIEPDMAAIESVFTNEKTKEVYLLDKINSRIVITDKKGKYTAQYHADELEKATSLVALEEKNLIIFLADGNKLFSIETKHRN